MLVVYLLIKSNRFKSFQIPKLNQRANVSDKILQSKQRKIFYYVYIHIKTLLNLKKKQAMDHIAQLNNNTLNFDEVCFIMSNSKSYSLFISMYNLNPPLWSQPTTWDTDLNKFESTLPEDASTLFLLFYFIINEHLRTKKSASATLYKDNK